MTTQLPEKERKKAGENHRDGQRNMMIIREDHMRLVIDMTAMSLIMVAMSKFCSLITAQCEWHNLAMIFQKYCCY
jgi:hypothetical protein